MKNKKFIIFLVIGIIVAYFFIYLPMRKKKLAFQIVEKYGTIDFDYSLLVNEKLKCLNGLLIDPKYVCEGWSVNVPNT